MATNKSIQSEGLLKLRLLELQVEKQEFEVELLRHKLETAKKESLVCGVLANNAAACPPDKFTGVAIRAFSYALIAAIAAGAIAALIQRFS